METTTVVLARSRSHSLRTTLPASLVRQFGIGEGSLLGWNLELRDGKLTIVVKPLKRFLGRSEDRSGDSNHASTRNSWKHRPDKQIPSKRKVV